MSQVPAQLTGRKLLGLVAMVVSLILLSACGTDDSDETSPTESLGELGGTAETSRQPETVDSASSSPESPPLNGDGTPVSDSSTESDVVVSAPPVTIPTMESTLPPAATPAAGGEILPPALTGSEDTVAGDGTGGAVSSATDGAVESGGLVQASPQASTLGGVTVVDSCDVSVSPPYSGDDPDQVTTSDVNFRAGPGSDCEVVGETIGAGTAVLVLSDPVQREGDDELLWVVVSIDGVDGWLATDFLE